MYGRWITTMALVGAMTLSAVRDARACGGCFAPPGAVQTVTGHRMVLSVSQTQTTLWDQFSYAGNPADFSWILPIRSGPDVRIELADDRFLQVLDNLSVPALYAPQRPYRFCGGAEDFAGARSADASAASDAAPPVIIHRQEVVGPYSVVVIGGADPMAIRDWLTHNGYAVPRPVEPVIDYYTGLGMDFIALRLRPGEGISRMSPVRVTVPGYAPTLPLRMISAGVADRVGLTLMVVAAARMEAQNFPNGNVTPEQLTYDFDHPTVAADDFRAVVDDMDRRAGGRLWLTESAQTVQHNNLRNLAQNSRNVLQGRGPLCGDPPGDGGTGGGPDVVDTDATDPGGPDSGPSGDGGAACVEPDPAADVDLAFAGLGENAVLTRVTANLAVTALDRDLMLTASTLGELSRDYRYGHVLNTPAPQPCPTYGPDGRPINTGFGPSWGCSGRCQAPAGTPRGTAGGVALSVGAVAVVVARRRRRGALKK